MSFVGILAPGNETDLTNLWPFSAHLPLRVFVCWVVSSQYGGSRDLLLHSPGGFMLHWRPGRHCLLCSWPTKCVSDHLLFTPSLLVSQSFFSVMPPVSILPISCFLSHAIVSIHIYLKRCCIVAPTSKTCSPKLYMLPPAWFAERQTPISVHLLNSWFTDGVDKSVPPGA